MINNRIKDLELMIYNKKISLLDAKRSFELLMFNKTLELQNLYNDTKDKSLSNEEKREHVAMQDVTLSELRDKIQKEENEIRVLEIECDYQKREFNLRISAQEDLQEIRLEIKRVGDILENWSKVIK